MAKILKVELLLDLSAPVEEIAAVVNIMLDAHLGQQMDILRAVDEQIGLALAKLEMSQRDPEFEEVSDEKDQQPQ